jgi:hypothetical protein
MNRVLVLPALLLTGCGTTAACSSNAVKDTSPSWRLANRLTGELNVDCNTTQANKSVGITGCAFVKGAVGGNLIIPPLYTGRVTGVSYNCKNFTVQTDQYNANYLQMADLYTATNAQSCSFTLGRTLIYSGKTADDTMMSRVFIKIIPDDKYYSKMNFTVNKVNFQGVGWYQSKTSLVEVGNDPILTIYPTGTKGVFKVTCGDKIILSQVYTTSPFTVEFPETMRTCDYELSATNGDSSKIDLGTFVYNVAYSTIDISNPVVTIKRSNITFNFKDKLGGGYVVAGIKADATLCENTNSCTIPHNKDLYYIRALTMSARFYFASYRVSTGKFEVYQ